MSEGTKGVLRSSTKSMTSESASDRSNDSPDSDYTDSEKSLDSNYSLESSSEDSTDLDDNDDLVQDFTSYERKKYALKDMSNKKSSKTGKLARSLVGNLVVTPSIKNILETLDPELDLDNSVSGSEDDLKTNEVRKSIKDLQMQFTIAKKDKRVRVSC